MNLTIVPMAMVSLLAPSGSPVPKLHVQVCDKPCDIEEQVEIKVRIENRGKGPFYFYSEFSWGAAGYLDFEVFRQNGEPVPSRIAIDDWTIEAFREPELEKLIELEPGQSIETGEKLYVDELVEKPGKYRMMVRYVSRAPWPTFKGLPVWNRDSGPILGSTWFEVSDGK